MGPPDDEHTVVARRGRRAPAPEPAADAVDDATQMSARRTPANAVDEIDDATRLSARRTPAHAADEIDDATRLSARRARDPHHDATELAQGRRSSAPSAPGTGTPPVPWPVDLDTGAHDSGPSRTTTGSAAGERTDETILRSVRRTPPVADPEPQPSAGIARRTAYVPGGEASEVRLPRRPDAAMATRQPVAPPSSVAPAPAPEAIASQRRRERRRLLIASGIAVLVLVAAAVALVLLLI